MKSWSFIVGYLCVFASSLGSPAKMCKDWFYYKSRTRDQVQYHETECDSWTKRKAKNWSEKMMLRAWHQKKTTAIAVDEKWNMRATTSRDDYDLNISRWKRSVQRQRRKLNWTHTLLQNHNQMEFQRIYILHPRSTVRSMIRCVSIHRFSLSSTVLEERLLEIQLILPPSLTQVLREN